MACEGIISIPSELITEILYRLPSKSVGRFRCVSKEWLSLLSAPEFIKNHQNTLNRNYVFLHPSCMTGAYFIPFHYHEEAKDEESVPTKFHLQVPDVNLIFNGSSNGLVFLSAFRHCSGHETLMVLNPTTKEYVELPNCDFKIAGHEFASRIMCELGYDYVTDDYKLVTINQFLNLNGHDHIMSVHIYSLRRNTWTRVIDYPDKYRPFDITSFALVNRSFHWVATKVFDQKNIIVAFSLADENFSELPSPSTLGNDNDVDILNRACRIAVVDKKLAIFWVFKGKVWLMNEYWVKGSWTNVYVMHITIIYVGV
ncbi:F-box/kelch-repeat protein At3g06240-like [Rutidosis leptorrhynchoides]|uniref:F-box/kelch-repeat protein At3g06240-like n=1 Tax=Rutidosis leptorrhynchoides TaxID=125765 RepID=UPI003A997CD2